MGLKAAFSNFLQAKDFDDENGFYEDDYYDEEESVSYNEPVRNERPAHTPIQFSRTDNEKVLSMNTKKDFGMECYVPKKNLDVTTITQGFKNGKVCIINISFLSNNEAQTMVDFIAGAAFALNGSIKQLSDSIILVTPSNVSVKGEVYEELAKFTANSGLFN